MYIVTLILLFLNMQFAGYSIEWLETIFLFSVLQKTSYSFILDVYFYAQNLLVFVSMTSHSSVTGFLVNKSCIHASHCFAGEQITG